MIMLLRCCAVTSLMAALMLPATVCAAESENYEKDAQQAESTPPMIPHRITDTSDGKYCLGCHRTGLNGAPETPHPERLSCTGCHGQGEIREMKRGEQGTGKEMNISRKEFFRKSLLSLGEAICSVSDALKPPAGLAMERQIPDVFDATPVEDLVAAADNKQCLARSSGCFACMERCDPGAIKLIPGVGVRVNRQLCTGCGACEYVCPVTPKAICLKARMKDEG